MKNLGNVFILGDSYSTFIGYIPEGYASWYLATNTDETDITKVEETWWHQLLSNTESNLILNNSWSGATMCHTGWNGDDYSEKKSFCARLRNLVNEGFFEKNNIDTFFIFGGLNDSAANSPLGEIKYGNKTEEELFFVKPAYCYLIESAMKNCSNARIVSIIDSAVKPEIAACMEEVSNHYGTEIVKIEPVDKILGHPSVNGMQQTYNQIFEKL